MAVSELWRSFVLTPRRGQKGSASKNRRANGVVVEYVPFGFVSALTVQLLHAFEKLPAEERQEFVEEVLRRVQPRDSRVGLRERGIAKAQAADLRTRLKTFAEDWDRPEAAIYDEDPAL